MLTCENVCAFGPPCPFPIQHARSSIGGPWKGSSGSNQGQSKNPRSANQNLFPPVLWHLNQTADGQLNVKRHKQKMDAGRKRKQTTGGFSPPSSLPPSFHNSQCRCLKAQQNRNPRSNHPKLILSSAISRKNQNWTQMPDMKSGWKSR